MQRRGVGLLITPCGRLLHTAGEVGGHCCALDRHSRARVARIHGAKSRGDEGDRSLLIFESFDSRASCNGRTSQIKLLSRMTTQKKQSGMIGGRGVEGHACAAKQGLRGIVLSHPALHKCSLPRGETRPSFATWRGRLCFANDVTKLPKTQSPWLVAHCLSAHQTTNVDAHVWWDSGLPNLRNERVVDFVLNSSCARLRTDGRHTFWHHVPTATLLDVCITTNANLLKRAGQPRLSCLKC
jgi:hypothetical protein